MSVSAETITMLRDALLAEAPECDVELDHYGESRCSAEPSGIAWGPNMSAEGDIIEMESGRESWTMYRNVAFDGHTIPLLLMCEGGYLSVEPITDGGNQQVFARSRAMLTRGIFTIHFEDAEVRADAAACASEVFEFGRLLERRRYRKS